MLKRPFALLVALQAMVHGREARADECGDSPELIAENVTISPKSIAGCVTITVGGTSRPGCDGLTATVQNNCDFPIYGPFGYDNECTDPGIVEEVVEEDGMTCRIMPGEVDDIWLPADATGPVTYEYPIIVQGEVVTLTITANLVDISGCSIGHVGAGGGSRAWVGLGGLGLALSLLRRRTAKKRVFSPF
ncbi:Hypothetical protein A7982_05602 [Minicystis rosea]|nr:Hypothetical protein A7982_05602 [Minicystis rosea]